MIIVQLALDLMKQTVMLVRLIISILKILIYIVCNFVKVHIQQMEMFARNVVIVK